MQKGLIAGVALLMLTWSVSSSRNITCPEDLNPFFLNQEAVGFPVEQISIEGNFTAPKTMLDMGFKLMPQDTVSCWRNRFVPAEQVSHLNITQSYWRTDVGVSEGCRAYIKTWLAKVTDTVLHNLLIVIKSNSVWLFNKYFDMKLVVFGQDRLITDSNEKLLDILENLGQDLNKYGKKFTSKDVETPTSSFYYAYVGNFVTAYKDIKKYYKVEERVILPTYRPDNVDKQFLNDLVLGTASNRGIPVYGYIETHYRLIAAITQIRSQFGFHTHRLPLPLIPMVPPCFSID